MYEKYEPLIVRKSEPNKYDHAPKGTYCRVVLSDHAYKIFQQLSDDEEHPQWEVIEVSFKK